MCTLLGGVGERDHTGYAGQWHTWEVTPGSSIPKQIDSSVNIRLWRILDPSSMEVQQSNLYQAPDKMAGPSTRFAPYLTGNTMAGRADGYGLRVWSFTPESDLANPDSSAWRTDPVLAERSMKVLSVPHQAATIINGSLPSGFEEDHAPRFWVLEFIARESGDPGRRWASMAWYELGQLVVTRAINEDLVKIPGEPALEEKFIDPKDIDFAPRREGTIEDIEGYYHSKCFSPGTFTSFSYDDDMQLLMAEGQCSWEERQAGPGGVLHQAFPDWSYCRLPRDLPAAVKEGPNITFEAGTVMRDGSIARWLLTYNTGGNRTLAEARYEQYQCSNDK